MIIWHSVDDFLAMGGYGLYVWGSVGMSALLIAGELVALRLRWRQTRRDQSSDQGAP